MHVSHLRAVAKVDVLLSSRTKNFRKSTFSKCGLKGSYNRRCNFPIVNPTNTAFVSRFYLIGCIIIVGLSLAISEWQEPTQITFQHVFVVGTAS